MLSFKYFLSVNPWTEPFAGMLALRQFLIVGGLTHSLDIEKESKTYISEECPVFSS